MDEKQKAFIGLNFSIFLVGVTGLFGKIISTSAFFIVFGRVLFAVMALFLFLKLKREKLKPNSAKDMLMFLGLGALLTFHWFAFFHSIKLSSVAIGLLTFGTFPIFTTFLEPIFLKTKFTARDLIVAVICFVGVALVVPNLNFQTDYGQGAIWGIIAGLSYAFIVITNKTYVARYSSVTLTFYQFSVSLLICLPVVLWMQETVLPMDWVYLAFNGVICTALAHSLYIYSSRYIDAQTISVLTMMEVLYGIVLAYFILNETITLQMGFGGGLIMLASYLAVRKHR